MVIRKQLKKTIGAKRIIAAPARRVRSFGVGAAADECQRCVPDCDKLPRQSLQARTRSMTRSHAASRKRFISKVR